MGGIRKIGLSSKVVSEIDKIKNKSEFKSQKQIVEYALAETFGIKKNFLVKINDKKTKK